MHYAQNATSGKQAIENKQTNFLHTFFPILGIVIGVGALVIDGMELYAYDQISNSTGLVAVLIGIIFGTYPPLRAARPDPVDPIRRE